MNSNIGRIITYSFFTFILEQIIFFLSKGFARGRLYECINSILGLLNVNDVFIEFLGANRKFEN